VACGSVLVLEADVVLALEAASAGQRKAIRIFAGGHHVLELSVAEHGHVHVLDGRNLRISNEISFIFFLFFDIPRP
jgi:hypothetical protein